MPTPIFPWRPYAIAFALGALVIGGFDFLYTHAGGQSYFAQWIVPPFEKWPIYVPIQMGLAGVFLLIKRLLWW